MAQNPSPPARATMSMQPMPSSFKRKHGEHCLIYRMEMDEESLADFRRDNTIKTTCVRFGVDYDYVE
eukprot:scaffold1419_cov96-Skeletonema_dohrnii-CCMP3373.AAC.1